MKRVTILLDDRTAAELNRRAAKSGATMSGQIRAAIRMWLSEDVEVRGEIRPVSEFAGNVEEF